MRSPLRLHRPTVVARFRTDARLVVLIGVVVALTTVLTAAVEPMTERTADRAIAATVRDAGPRGSLVATFPQDHDDPRKGKTREPRSVVELRQDTADAEDTMPDALAEVVRPGVATLTTPQLHLLDAGPGRYLTLAYVDPPGGAPAVSYVAGGPPLASVGEDQAEVTVPADGDPWPVQVAVSESVASALGLEPGDRLPAEDEQARNVDIRISGVFRATSPGDEAWLTVPRLLSPAQGLTEGVERTSGAALVSPESLPDLRLAIPAYALTQRVVFAPQPSRLTWGASTSLAQDVASLKASSGLARDSIAWDSLLDRVLEDAGAQVVAARGQAEVLLVGLLASALLLLVLAALLLVRRRRGAVSLARERGASLLTIGAELLVEALAVAVAGALVGLLVTRQLVGEAGVAWSLPVVVVASLAAPLLGATAAARATHTRRVPANRSARRTLARARRTQRLVLELAILAVAVLTFVALHQRGVVGDDGGDLTAASAATWWTVGGAVLVLRMLPSLTGWLLAWARRSTGGVRYFAMVGTAQSGIRVLPLVLITMAVAQLTIGMALAATEREGQSAGALLSVGGDARLTTTPGRSVHETAQDIAAAPGVAIAVAARVEDGIRASSRQNAASVRLVVVDAAAYKRLLAGSRLADAPDLAQLTRGGDRVAALLLGGDPGLADELVVRWDDATVPLEVVGVAPRVGASVDPVVVVDAEAFADSGAVADPNTVWALGSGAVAAVRAATGSSGSVTSYADVLDARRDAPLAAGLTRLAIASSALLLLFAVLGVVLAAATERPAREESLGRLRSLGLPGRDLWRVLVAELMTPVVLGAVAGLVLGVGAAATMFGALDLERVTGESASPVLVLPWWPLLAAAALCLAVLVVARTESTRLRHTSLAQLLRAGESRP